MSGFRAGKRVAMRLGMHEKKLNMIRAAALVILAAALCLTGCGAGQNSAGRDNAAAQSVGQDAAAAQGGGQDNTAAQSAGQGSAQNSAAARTSPGGLRPEEMAQLCYYRYEKDDSFDADMEIVEGRIDALTDGNYLMEATELEAPEGILDAVTFYVPTQVYGDSSLRDISRILISRPMNLWLCNDTSDDTWNNFTDQIPLPRDAIESAEVLYGCPEHFNPIDYGIKLKEFHYLKIRLTEDYCRENPQIWEWKQPTILQDIEGYEGYAHMSVYPDAENRCIIFMENEDRPGYCDTLHYSLTHEPLSEAFYLISFPLVEWESGEAVKGAGQIENTGFSTATTVIEYVPEEEYVSDKNWEQTLQAIRERLDASGLPYALGHRPGVDRSIVIRMEKGLFTDNFLDYVIEKTTVRLSSCGETLSEAASGIKASAQNRSGKKVLALDMSALRKEAFNKLSMNCVKKGGGRIVLTVNTDVVAYGYCDSVINDGKFVMDYNAVTAENGFSGESEWMPDFWAALISGTQIPTIYTSTAAVTLHNTEQIFLNEEGQPCIQDLYNFPRDNFYAELKNRLGDLEYVQAGFLTSGTPCVQFALPKETAMPEGDTELSEGDAELPQDEAALPEGDVALPEGGTRNEQIAAVMSKVFKRLGDDIFTYWMRIDFVDESGAPQLVFVTHSPDTGSKTRIGYTMYYETGFTEEDEAEIRGLLADDESLADLAASE